MKTTLAERLKLAREEAKISQKTLGELVGISQAAIQKLEVGGARSSTKLIEIAKCLYVRPEWLSNGEGSMRPDGVLISEISFRPIKEWSGSDPLEDDEVEIPYFKSIELAAGDGRCVNEDFNGFKLRFSRATLRRYGADPKNVVSFPVEGSSMAPMIPDHATVTVDMGNTNIVDDGIYAIAQDDLFRVKLLYRQPGGKLIIRSYNSSEFPDETADIDTVKIIGRVINWSVMAW